MPFFGIKCLPLTLALGLTVFSLTLDFILRDFFNRWFDYDFLLRLRSFFVLFLFATLLAALVIPVAALGFSRGLSGWVCRRLGLPVLDLFPTTLDVFLTPVEGGGDISLRHASVALLHTAEKTVLGYGPVPTGVGGYSFCCVGVRKRLVLGVGCFGRRLVFQARLGRLDTGCCG